MFLINFACFFVSIFHIIFHFIFHKFRETQNFDEIIFDFAKLFHRISRKFRENVWFRFRKISRNFAKLTIISLKFCVSRNFKMAVSWPPYSGAFKRDNHKKGNGELNKNLTRLIFLLRLVKYFKLFYKKISWTSKKYSKILQHFNIQ